MVGKVIKEYMDKKGITQVSVSKKTGITPQILGQILKETRKIETSEFFTICEAIEVNPMEIAKRAGIYAQQVIEQTIKQEATA